MRIRSNNLAIIDLPRFTKSQGERIVNDIVAVLGIVVLGFSLFVPRIEASEGGSRDSDGPYDLLIVNARVVDGTGNPWFWADIGIRGDRIVAIGGLKRSTARRTIDAHGRVVAPGFIDLMGASDWELLVDPRAASKLTQGITLMVSGEGTSVAPVNERTLRDQKPYFDKYHITPSWRTLEEFFRLLEANPPAIHFATFVGAGGLRDLVVGKENRAATSSELAEMQRLTAQAMEQGAMGLSTALMYVPDRFASTDEIISLAKVAASYGGIYATHQRSQGDGMQSSLDEVFRIAREAEIPAHIFHLKIAYRQNWGGMGKAVQRIEAARSEGLSVTADVYPYVAASADVDALMPLWAREGGSEKMLQRLRDPALRQRIKNDLKVSTTEWENEYYGVGGAEGILITDVLEPSLKPLVGRRLSEIAKEQNNDPVDVLMDLLLKNGGPVRFVSFITNEADLRLALQQNWAAFCNDSGISALDGPFADSFPHPRAFGAFPRILGRYIREDHVLTLEDAVRKATSLPAQILGLRYRGLVREGFYADLVMFNPETIIDRATYERPLQYSVGVDNVLVDGVVVLDEGHITTARPGKVLRGPGFKKQ
jgi:N-acyl-D-amino-acid deacylase